ncbi:hypothetical protein Cgig2_029717 [Carnegiea gigantea]|uniref:Uncharacterized protein n=1 Tax=Carnegiea gigantea TaxID=171969 RepID=A0A9Q1GRG8_9CARY|nr:hypothetical protein Cgig2_029717 [Carnegiea gigantea]
MGSGHWHPDVLHLNASCLTRDLLVPFSSSPTAPRNPETSGAAPRCQTLCSVVTAENSPRATKSPRLPYSTAAMSGFWWVPSKVPLCTITAGLVAKKACELGLESKIAFRLPQLPTRNLPTDRGRVRVPCEHPLNCCLMPLVLFLLGSLVVCYPYHDFFVYLANHPKVLLLDPFESVHLEVEGLVGNINREMLRGESAEGSITKITNLIDAVEILTFCTASNLPNFQLNKKPHHEVWEENIVDLEK